MAQVRSFEEAERLINELGTPPHDEHIMLNDGRLLKTPDEVRAWVYSLVDGSADAGAEG